MKIGFVDYYISEWHANNYPRWMAQKCEELGIDAELAYAWAELDVSLVDGVSTKEWCEANGCQKCETVEKLCEKSDAIVILAPSNPEKHLEYAKNVLKYGKPTYIDKTFADNFENAKAIYALADEYNAKFFSTSALRYADELEEARGARELHVTGGGSSVQEYIIHQIEMAVKVMGTGFKSVVCAKEDEKLVFTLDRVDGKTVTLTYKEGLKFAFEARFDNKEAVEQTAKSPYFKTLMVKILEFFENGELPFDREQTLEAMRVRDAVLKSVADMGNRVYLD